MLRIDLNADLGESFGVYRMGSDEALLPWVTSANIACGFHAGDPHIMARIVAAAVAKGVALGAHPGLPDLIGFGRRLMAISPNEAGDIVTYQIGALAAFAGRHGQRLQHIKPHGALYWMAETDSAIADEIALAVIETEPALILVGLSGGRLISAGQALGLRVAHEVFADRTYQPDGTLTPRSQPHAMLNDPRLVAARIARLVREGVLAASDGTELHLAVDTVCVHGNSPDAPALAQAIRETLEAQGITVCRLDLP